MSSSTRLPTPARARPPGPAVDAYSRILRPRPRRGSPSRQATVHEHGCPVHEGCTVTDTKCHYVRDLRWPGEASYGVQPQRPRLVFRVGLENLGGLVRHRSPRTDRIAPDPVSGVIDRHGPCELHDRPFSG